MYGIKFISRLTSRPNSITYFKIPSDEKLIKSLQEKILLFKFYITKRNVLNANMFRIANEIIL